MTMKRSGLTYCGDGWFRCNNSKRHGPGVADMFNQAIQFVEFIAEADRKHIIQSTICKQAKKIIEGLINNNKLNKK